MSDAPLYLTDRTRITTYQVCPRLRFLSFHFGGRGLVPLLKGYEVRFGGIYHDALKLLYEAQASAEIPDPDGDVIGAAGRAVQAEAERTPEMPPFWATEQRYLMEGLLWAWTKVRRPRLREDYEIVALEREFTWDMGQGITLMVRLDGLLRDRSMDSLVYQEHKTTAYGNDRWAEGFTHNGQVMAGTLACEQVLLEKPTSVTIEGHVKGARRVDTSYNSEVRGFEFQDSPLCYLWQFSDNSVSAKWAREASRVSAWSTGASPREWVEQVLSPLELENCFRVLPLLMPDQMHLARWLRQTLAQEVMIRDALIELGRPDLDLLEQRRLLDEVFPLHEESCNWQYGRRCSHWRFCHDATTAVDPLNTPGFTPRIPHHPIEMETLGERRD